MGLFEILLLRLKQRSRNEGESDKTTMLPPIEIDAFTIPLLIYADGLVLFSKRQTRSPSDQKFTKILPLGTATE